MEPLHTYAWCGDANRLRIRLGKGIPVDHLEHPHTGWPKEVPVSYWAAWGGHVEVMQLLIEHGIPHDLEVVGNGERGIYALHEAVAPSDWEEGKRYRWCVGPSPSGSRKRRVAELILEDGADYDIYTACALDDLARVKALTPPVSGHFGMTPLHWAARAGALDCVEYLIAKGADVNALNDNKRPPIVLAAERNEGATILALADAGADLDTQDKKGRSALHRATYEGCAEAAEALLEAGANGTLLNKNGKTAFEIARKGAKHLKKRAS